MCCGRLIKPSPTLHNSLPCKIATCPEEAMLRITEIKLPLDHPPETLPAAILERLGSNSSELLAFSIFKRSYDARSRNNIQLIYIVDVQVQHEEQLLQKFANDPHIKVTPDMAYQFVAHAASQNPKPRPVVIGMGP